MALVCGAGACALDRVRAWLCRVLPPASPHPSVRGQCRGPSDIVQVVEFAFIITPSTTRVEVSDAPTLAPLRASARLRTLIAHALMCVSCTQLALFCGGVQRLVQLVVGDGKSPATEWLSVKLVASFAGVPVRRVLVRQQLAVVAR